MCIGISSYLCVIVVYPIPMMTRAARVMKVIRVVRVVRVMRSIRVVRVVRVSIYHDLSPTPPKTYTKTLLVRLTRVHLLRA